MARLTRSKSSRIYHKSKRPNDHSTRGGRREESFQSEIRLHRRIWRSARGWNGARIVSIHDAPEYENRIQDYSAGERGTNCFLSPSNLSVAPCDLWMLFAKKRLIPNCCRKHVVDCPGFPFPFGTRNCFLMGMLPLKPLNPHYDGLRVISWANNVVYHACGAIQ